MSVCLLFAQREKMSSLAVDYFHRNVTAVSACPSILRHAIHNYLLATYDLIYLI